jgi:hypothetical protein
MRSQRALLLGLIVVFAVTCKRDVPVPAYQSRKLVFILLDGPRWEETWGDTAHQYQPYLRDSLRQQGSLFTAFYNNGITFTVPGHTALLTGHYQDIQNNGAEYPDYPGLPQLYLKRYGLSSDAAWLVTSKDKLEVFKSCEDPEWSGKYEPLTNCGVNGNGTGYRHDTITFAIVKDLLKNKHPDFLFLQFRDPDYSAHMNDISGYIQGIVRGDKYCWEIWKLLQEDKYYSGQTTFIITNDHGRHPDGTLDGFISHGDGCPGCRHINLFMAGPDIKKNIIIDKPYEQTDIHKTICKLFGLDDRFSEGKVIRDALIK